MKFKYNLLYEENADLKLQLHTLHNQLNENRKLVQKDTKYDDFAMQTDLVCNSVIVLFISLLPICK